MHVRNFRLAALFATFLAAACASDDDSQQASGFTAPAGVVIGNDRGAAAMKGGLFVSPTANDPSCCWISADAKVTATKTGAADNIVVTIGIPGYKFYADGGQTVTVSVDGRSTTFPNLKQGNHSLSAKLDDKLRTFVGPVDVVIHSARPFVPMNEGVNGDKRRLGVLLRGVAFS